MKLFKHNIVARATVIFVLLSCLMTWCVTWYFGADDRANLKQIQVEQSRIEKIQIVRQELSRQLGPAFTHNEWPSDVEINLDDNKRQLKVNYTLNNELQKEAANLLRAYKPDFGAIVVMDADSGAIRALVSYEKGQVSSDNLALLATYPAASVFKIVTATAALDKYNLSPDTLVMFNGANHTLYKKNVLSNKVNRWTRGITLRDAFARSINTVFGRLTFEHLQPQDLQDYAIRFGFNQNIASDLPFATGFTDIPNEKNFHLAEMASGYNKITRMSPVQGAMIAASVAESGTMRVPYVVESLQDESGQIVWKPDPVTAAVTMSAEGANRLKELMEATVKQGTSRKSFRNLVHNKKFQEIELGGKTGSLTGDNPKGKVDWFVGYGIGGDKDRLSIAAITVNRAYWTVKSSFLAQSLLKKHFKDQFSERNSKFFNASLAQDHP